MATYANVDSGNQTFYLAQVSQVLGAGKTMEIDLFDPGDVGQNAWLRILSPDGSLANNYASFTWTANSNAASGHTSSGGTVTCIQTYGGSSGVSAPSGCTTYSSGGTFFQNSWVKILVPIPGTYGQTGLQPPGDPAPGWRKIKYTVQSATTPPPGRSPSWATRSTWWCRGRDRSAPVDAGAGRGRRRRVIRGLEGSRARGLVGDGLSHRRGAGPATLVAGGRRTSGIRAQFVLSNKVHASVEFLSAKYGGLAGPQAAANPGPALMGRRFDLGPVFANVGCYDHAHLDRDKLHARKPDVDGCLVRAHVDAT